MVESKSEIANTMAVARQATSAIIGGIVRRIAGLVDDLFGGTKVAALTRAEVDEFLSQPRTAQLVTLRAAGTPHVAPVWFLWDEGRALVMADSKAIKVRNIRRNPAVALCVCTPDHPYVFVTIEGTANIADTGLEDMVQRTCILYEGDERGAEFAAELLGDQRLTLISISPDRFISWKKDDE